MESPVCHAPSIQGFALSGYEGSLYLAIWQYSTLALHVIEGALVIPCGPVAIFWAGCCTPRARKAYLRKAVLRCTERPPLARHPLPQCVGARCDPPLLVVAAAILHADLCTYCLSGGHHGGVPSTAWGQVCCLPAYVHCFASKCRPLAWTRRERVGDLVNLYLHCSGAVDLCALKAL